MTTVDHILPDRLVPGDIILYDGHWITVTGIYHDVALRQVKIAGLLQVGVPSTIRVSPNFRLPVVRDTAPAPEVAKPDQSGGPRVPYPRGGW